MINTVELASYFLWFCKSLTAAIFIEISNFIKRLHFYKTFFSCYYSETDFSCLYLLFQHCDSYIIRKGNDGDICNTKQRETRMAQRAQWSYTFVTEERTVNGYNWRLHCSRSQMIPKHVGKLFSKEGQSSYWWI